MITQLEKFEKQLEGGKLAQSFLVSGPEKTGKFSAVVEMVGMLNKLGKDQLDLVCRGEMADIILIETEIGQQERRLERADKNKRSQFQVNKSKSKKPKTTITKKQIDSAMKNIGLKNFQLDKKVIIIKGADKMTNTAVNSLLKLIEEPTDNLVIFLLVNNEDDILTTIRSRCQNIRFSFIDDTQINKIVQKEHSLDEDISQNIVDLSGGRIELAKQYASDTKKIKLAREVRDDFRKALRGGKLEQITLIDKLTKSEKDLLWVMNEWIWYLKFFLEKNIQSNQPVAVIKKIHFILKNLLETRDLIKTTNVSKKVQLENFFVQI